MNYDKKRILIVGATSAMAEHCARLWVNGSKVELILIGRNLAKTEQVAMDLRVRSPQSTVNVFQANFIDPVIIQQVVDDLFIKGAIDIALIAHGALFDQDTCQRDLIKCCESLQINGVSPVLFAEAIAGNMQKIGRGTLAIIGSVAGDRGRKSNYIYGSAKGLVDKYAQGLQHRFANSAVKVVLIKPGPTDTPMTAHLKKDGAKLASVESVAAEIIKCIDEGRSILYSPARWKWIMLVIKHLPKFVFNKLDI